MYNSCDLPSLARHSAESLLVRFDRQVQLVGTPRQESAADINGGIVLF